MADDRAVLIRILLLFGFLILLSDILRAQDTTTVATARITYLTASSAYIDAGTERGIREGQRLEVVRGDSVIAVLQAAYVSGQRASCSILSRTAEPVVGDLVQFAPAAVTPPSDTSPAPVVAVTPPVATPRSGRASREGLHGRIGVRYLVTRQTSGEARFSQPALDLRLDGPLGGSGFSLGLDLRARRTTSTWADGTSDEDGSYRLYDLSLTWNRTGSPVRLTLGRQFSAAFASVSFFDGLKAEYLKPRWSAGLFGGTQPDPVNFSFATDIQEYGGYLQFRNRPGGSGHWSLTGGAIGSYVRGTVNREFLFFQSSLYSKTFSGYVTQEVDYNRDWKVGAGEPTLAPTSTYASVSLRPLESVTLRGGFDNRRNVRLYRDFVNPETQFDDAFRQGYWGGVTLRPLQGYQVGLDARASTGGSAGRSQSYTVTLGADRLLGEDLSLRTRFTRYLAPNNEGWLHSASLGVSLFQSLHGEVTGGIRNNFDSLDNPESTRITWLGLDLDLAVGRRWFLVFSANHESGTNEASDQVFGGVSLRF
jgi:hypothetical protein